jgi:hypothetical protein
MVTVADKPVATFSEDLGRVQWISHWEAAQE